MKLKGHLICPNCGKETDFILKRGEAVVWCRRCRNYFIAVLKLLTDEQDGIEEGPPLQRGRAADRGESR